jgi:hypothetical protein
LTIAKINSGNEMMSEEMVERVARAMADFAAEGCEVTVGGGSIAACVGPCRCRELARTAIAAMREPTEAMVEATKQLYEPGGPGYRSVHAGDLATWHAMIDAALEQG